MKSLFIFIPTVFIFLFSEFSESFYRLHDQRDRTLQDFALDFRGVSIGGALLIHLNPQGGR